MDLQSLVKKLDEYAKPKDKLQPREVIVPTAGIKDDILSAHANWKKQEGAASWPVPIIRTWDEHLQYTWDRCRHEFPDYRLLTRQEFRYHWMKAGFHAARFHAAPAKDEVRDRKWMNKYVSRTCDNAITMWKRLNDYRIIPLPKPEQPDDSLQALFYRWVHRYRETAREQKWLSESELPGFLADKLKSPGLLCRYATPALFLTLPWQETIRDYYIKKCVEATPEARQKPETECLMELAGENGGAITFGNHAFKFTDTNRELQAVATQAREWLTKEIEVPPTVRIGIVVPNLPAVHARMRRQFLATFCPNGHWAWQFPRFKIHVRQSLGDTPLCAEILSYLRLRHAGSIVYSKARNLVHSGQLSGVVPEEDLEELRKSTNHDREIDSEIPSPWHNREIDSEKTRKVSAWMKHVESLLENCRASLKIHRDAEFLQLIEEFRVAPKSEETADRLDKLFKDRDGSRVPECLSSLAEEIADAGTKRNGSGEDVLQVDEDARLSRLDWLIERFRQDSVVRRMQEIAEDLRDAARRDHSPVPFDEAYEHFSSACAMAESAQPATARAPVEILSLQQATGRRFSHLWFVGMRDTDWPPPVRPNPLVDLKVLRKRAPSLFRLDCVAEGAMRAFRALVNRCDNPDNIRLSYAIRDAAGERKYSAIDSGDIREDGVDADEDGMYGDASWQDAGVNDSPEHAGAALEGMQPERPPREDEDDKERPPREDEKDKEWPLREEKIRFHPSYFPYEAKSPYEKAVALSTGLNDCVKPQKSEKSWDNAEYETQFECPFRAWAIHRLGIARPARLFGSPAVKKRDAVEDFRKLHRSQDAHLGVLEKVPASPGAPSGLCKFTVGRENYVIDCGIDHWGRHVRETLRPDPPARPEQGIVQPSGIARIGIASNDNPYNPYPGFTDRKKMYPMRVLRWAVARKSIIPGYVTSDRLNSVRFFGYETKKRPRGLQWSVHTVGPKERPSRYGIAVIEEILKKAEVGYNKGQLEPSPVGFQPSEGGVKRVAPICRDCHLQASCRFNYVDEPDQ